MVNTKENYASGEAKRIGDNVRKLRERANWTQAELARIASTSAQYLSSVERGERKPGSGLMGRLCDAFAVDERVIRFGDRDEVGTDMFTAEDMNLLHMLKKDREAYLAAVDLIRLDREKIFRIRTRIKSELSANGELNGSNHAG